MIPTIEIMTGGKRFYCRSKDAGMTWDIEPCELKWLQTPSFHGIANIRHTPLIDNKIYWDHLHISENGFGVATGHENKSENKGFDFRPLIFTTKDFGKNWEQNKLRMGTYFGWWLRLKTLCWPIDYFDSLLVHEDNIILSWDDPWVANNPEAYVIYSHDFGKVWKFHCLGETLPHIVKDNNNRILALNDGFYLISEDFGKNWHRQAFEIHRPEEVKDILKNNIICATLFTYELEGLSLAYHYHYKKFDIEILSTSNGGYDWQHLSYFEAPKEIQEGGIGNISIKLPMNRLTI